MIRVISLHQRRRACRSDALARRRSQRPRSIHAPQPRERVTPASSVGCGEYAARITERTRRRSTGRAWRLLPACLALSLGLLAAPGGAWGQIGLQLEAGLEGKVRAGRWAPVRLTATNNGVPVSG